MLPHPMITPAWATRPIPPELHQREIWLRSPDGYTVVVAGR